MAAENIITYHEPDKIWLKDPDEVEKYTIDWTQYLKGDTIASTDWYMNESTTASGITLSSETNTTTSASVNIGGGYHGGRYVLSNRIVTAASLTKEKKLIIHVLDSELRRLCS